MASLEALFPSLGFIGAGNMAGAILRGTVGRGLLRPQSVWACDVIADKLEEMKAGLGIQVTNDPKTVLAQTQAVVLAVKPQDSLSVLDAVREAVRPEHLIISIVAGKSTATLGEHLPEGTRIVRVMPNTPALVGLGAAGVAPGATATRADVEATLELFRAVGVALEVAERDIDAVTAVSGSGPAYVYRFMELMTQAGVELGLTPETAKALTMQTVLGAARMALDSPEPLEVLRERVTSKGGTTAAALAKFEELGLPAVIKGGLQAARDRSLELSQPAGH